MAKVFYTEHDIEDMAARGERSIVVGDDVVLTDLAYEKARRVGVELLQPDEKPPAAPVRPYLNKSNTAGSSQTRQASSSAAAAPSAASASARLMAIKARVNAAVKAQVGSQIDDAMLDRIIERVAADLGLT